MDVFDYIEKELDRIEVGYTSYDGTRLTMSIDDVRELIENLRKKLAQNLTNACTDTISRQAAIDDLRGKDPSQIWDTADVEVWVNTLPSVEPKRGKWEITNLGAVGAFDSCSECKRVVKHKAPFYNFCPNCGADMRG